MLRRVPDCIRLADAAEAKAKRAADPFVRRSYLYMAGSLRELAVFRGSLEHGNEPRRVEPGDAEKN